MTLLHNQIRIKTTPGFALLITIVIISVVLAVGISLLNITVKQINLSITGRDSEIAFSAAQAGVECAQMILNQNPDYVTGTSLNPSIDCIGTAGSLTQSSDTPQANVDEYSYQLSWDADADSDDDVCTDFDLYLIDATGGTQDVTFTNQGLVSYRCDDDEFCAVIFSRGYNRACTELDSLRAVQREITITL